MKLLHLRIACYLYNQFTDYDSSYLNLSQNYPNLDLNKIEHVKALIVWLRSWGCRQFKTDDEKQSIESIMYWYDSIKANIPNTTVALLDYDLSQNKAALTGAFDKLSTLKAATRRRGDQLIDVSIGPVGAAKTLFALRPNLFSPWDTPIYNDFQLEGNGLGYVNYLSKIQNELRDIKAELKGTDLNWNDLFKFLKKKHTSYPKLIDEYYWITKTQGCDPVVIASFINKKV